MTITVVGHLCIDMIHQPDRSTSSGYGGIFFTVAALANLLQEDDTIIPVFGVGKDDYDAFIACLEKYPNIDTSGIYKFNGPTNQVALYYREGKERLECSKFISDPIPLKKIRSKLGVDMILVNMISGNDITLDTLDEIRMDVRDDHMPIYLDVHSLTLGINDDFTRFHRPHEQWRRWLFMIHAAQMNEDEARVLTPEKLDEMSLAKHTLALNTKVLHITRGNRGCTSFIDDHKHVRRVDCDGVELKKVVDSTGCGDVFAAAYCAHYMRTGDIDASAAFANKVAAAKAGFAGSSPIDALSAFRLLAGEEKNPA
jgi:adenosine kinase